jgi:Glycine transporter
VLALDLVGTFVFALAGATAGVRRKLDIFGVAVLSFATACSGGIARDLLIGAVPPAALSDWRMSSRGLNSGNPRPTLLRRQPAIAAAHVSTYQKC